MLTLGQAAKETGLAKSAISRAIKSGRLSARKTEKGGYDIDPAELFRVYPMPVHREQSATQESTGILATKLAALLELKEQIAAERDNLRQRLDEEGRERQRLLTLLENLQHQITDQRTKAVEATQASPPRRTWFAWR